MRSRTGAGWPGCHGVRLEGAAARFGECEGDPLAEAEIRIGVPAAPGSVELWSQPQSNGEVQRSTVDSEGHTVLELGARRISLSPDRVITVAETFDWVETQLVASFILPLLVSGNRRLVLHAAAASRCGQGVVIAGPGGTGKSSSLVGLVEAGWTPLSEDVCVIDLAGPEPLVWPGPPWVRRRHGEGGPKGAAVLFESTEKTAWDVGPFRGAIGPTPVSSLILLEPPVARSDPERTVLQSGEAIAAVAPHAVWLGDQGELGRWLFGPIAEAASRIRVSKLRLPVRDDWVDLLVPLIS